MPRIVSVCLTHWPVTRLRRALREADDGLPMAVAALGSGGLRLTAVDARAHALGLRPGEPLGRVQARIGTPLRVHPADPEADAAALLRLCLWAQRYTPLVAPFGAAEGGEGLFLDVAGASHLLGGEAGLMADLAGRLSAHAIPARIALADTPGAAFALARHGRDGTIAAPGASAASLRALPVEALRLEPETVAALKRLGLRRIGALADAARAPLARRFGEALLTRLDQALGLRAEPLAPLGEAISYGAARGFLEPIGRQETIVATAQRLMGEIAPRLEADGLGACALRLTLHRVDDALRALDLGLAEPTRCPEHVGRLLRLRLDRLGPDLDAGFGFETVRLDVTGTGAMPARQGALARLAEPETTALARLADALGQRLGRRVIRLEARESHLPERADVLVPWGAVRAGGTPLPNGRARVRASAPGEGRDVSGEAAPLAPPLSRTEEGAGRGVPSILPPRSSGHGDPEPVTRVVLHWPGPEEGLRPRPLVLFERSEAAEEVIALAPEGPPERFRWRRRLHRVAHAEGPERIAPEWWRGLGKGSPDKTRDYYVVECESGRRLWLYRDGAHAPGEPAGWFVHGLFA
ncbi:protein ImuB [Methylobacterium sp. BE186]|uniref:Y-family DNA polymerase n=1 Tax=Methylobacterium sp. BE186 TaxID=2817715 RepID=UPI002867544A|nr:DNA polymerase Y family protein [Methylobacterium sp. BE186]MDR7036486.1 protein ImuB [Methylobacterium sp. BE186]